MPSRAENTVTALRRRFAYALVALQAQLRDPSAQSLVEYGMIAALVALVGIVLLRLVGHHAADTFSCMFQAFDHAGTC